MDVSTAVQIVIVIIAIGSWRQAKNPKLTHSERMAGYTCSVYFVLLAVTIFLTRISLVLAVKASALVAAVLAALRLFGKYASKDPRPHFDPEQQKMSTELFGKDHPEEFDVDHERWELSKLLAFDILLLAIALGLTSAVLWAILLLGQP